MSNRDRLRILSSTKELGALRPARLRALLPFVDEIHVSAGTCLAQEGRPCDLYLIVANGEIESCRQGRKGRLEPGDTAGWNAMHNRSRHDATLVAATNARLLVMSHSQFRAIRALVA
jgi:CRP-like cAMP-binding protein